VNLPFIQAYYIIIFLYIERAIEGHFLILHQIFLEGNFAIANEKNFIQMISFFPQLLIISLKFQI